MFVSLFVLFLAIYYWASIESFGKSLLSACSSIFLGAAIAFIINIPMSFLERRVFYKLKKGSRALSLVSAMAITFIVLFLLFSFIVPEFIASIKLLISLVPEIGSALREAFGDGVDPNLDYMIQLLSDPLNEISDILSKQWDSVLLFVMGFFENAFSMVVKLLVAFVFSIYILLGKDWLSKGSRRFINTFFTSEIAERIFHMAATGYDIFKKFFVGQAVEAVILGSLTTLGMLILQIPYAPMIGSLIGVTALVPIAGAWIGAIVGALMILPISLAKALVFLVFLLLLQQAEGNIIYPKVVGTSIGLKGIWVLAAVIVGGGLFGVLGMLCAVPLLALILSLLEESMQRREDSRKESSL